MAVTVPASMGTPDANLLWSSRIMAVTGRNHIYIVGFIKSFFENYSPQVALSTLSRVSTPRYEFILQFRNFLHSLCAPCRGSRENSFASSSANPLLGRRSLVGPISEPAVSVGGTSFSRNGLKIYGKERDETQCEGGYAAEGYNPFQLLVFKTI